MTTVGLKLAQQGAGFAKTLFGLPGAMQLWAWRKKKKSA